MFVFTILWYFQANFPYICCFFSNILVTLLSSPLSAWFSGTNDSYYYTLIFFFEFFEFFCLAVKFIIRRCCLACYYRYWHLFFQILMVTICYHSLSLVKLTTLSFVVFAILLWYFYSSRQDFSEFSFCPCLIIIWMRNNFWVLESVS